MQTRAFTFLSDGAAEVIDLGFRTTAGAKINPSWAFVKCSGQLAVFACRTMAAASYKEIGAGNVLVTSNGVTFGTDGTLTLGTSTQINTSGQVVSVWCGAEEASDGFATVGTYTGTGAANAITGVGFTPDVIFIAGESARQPAWRTSDITAGSGVQTGTAITAAWFTSDDADGFTLTTSATVNASTETFHYLCLKKESGRFHVQKEVVGTPTDDKTIAVAAPLGAMVDFALAKSNNTTTPKMRCRGTPGDLSYAWNTGAGAADIFQKLLPDAVEVGADLSVNSQVGGADAYFWFAANYPPLGNRLMLGMGQ